MVPPIISPALLFLILISATISSSAADTGGAPDGVSREFFPMDGDVAWVVQVSDLHISAYYPERADDLVRLLVPALRAIRPALLLVTGDITDAKNRRRTSTRQDESEWIQYRDTVKAIVGQSGIDKRAILDIRGNHDKYGVPFVGSDLDFFSTYSVSSQFDRLNAIQSISLVNGDVARMYMLGWRIRSPHSLIAEERIGTPDVMVITLPFLYMVVAPSILLVYGLFVERSGFLRYGRKISSLDRLVFSDSERGKPTPRAFKGRVVFLVGRICRGWTRRIILVACLVVICIHLKLWYNIMRAYGTEVVLSPAFWALPFLLAAAIYSTVTDV